MNDKNCCRRQGFVDFMETIYKKSWNFCPVGVFFSLCMNFFTKSKFSVRSNTHTHMGCFFSHVIFILVNGTPQYSRWPCCFSNPDFAARALFEKSPNPIIEIERAGFAIIWHRGGGCPPSKETSKPQLIAQ